MYLIVIQVPFQEVRPGAALVAMDWGRSLRLLRDSLEGRYGPIVVAAPTLSPDYEWMEQQPIELKAENEDIHLVGLCRANLRARHFWPQALSVYRRCLSLARQADVVHAGMSDLFRPIAQFGFYAAMQSHVPVVFVEDTDTVLQVRQLDGSSARFNTSLYCLLYEHVMRHAVVRADLTMLKAGTLMARYAGFAKNAKEFHDTSYDEGWVITADELNRKYTDLRNADTLRLISLGRLVARKGVDQTIQVVKELGNLGVSAELEIIGDGPQRKSLQSLVGTLGLSNRVSFLGVRRYDRSLVEYLRRFHLMLFTPIAEDTPRSLFDALAAGTPLAAYAIDYVGALAARESYCIMAPVGNPRALAEIIRQVWLDRGRFKGLFEHAAAAGHRHSAQAWYELRAAWTNEAVDRASSVRRNHNQGGACSSSIVP